MAHQPDMPAAARRLLVAGDRLMTAQPEVAGYLFGLAAECAVKAIATGIPSLRQDEIFYEHFPKLRALLRDAARGRMGGRLLRLLAHDGFMNGWHVSMRYARTADLKHLPVEAWRRQAADAISLMEGWS
jgi:hypothetical protein